MHWMPCRAVKWALDALVGTGCLQGLVSGDGCPLGIIKWALGSSWVYEVGTGCTRLYASISGRLMSVGDCKVGARILFRVKKLALDA